MFNPTTPPESTRYSSSTVIRKENSSFIKLLVTKSVDYLEYQVLISGERHFQSFSKVHFGALSI